jgi:diguanylate cyclase (GGDEF)-like protein
MKKPKLQDLTKRIPSNTGSDFLALAVSLAAFVFIFFVANSAFSFRMKVAGVLLVTIAYAIWYLSFFSRHTAEEIDLPEEQSERASPEIYFPEDIDTKLQALEEASLFFGASLKASDMFRLVTSRINEMIPFAVCALFLANEDQTKLKIIFSSGENSEILTNLEISSSKGLAGKVFKSGRSDIDKQLILDKISFPVETMSGLKSAIAAPLYRGSDIFGVLQLYGNREIILGESSLRLLDAIAERFSPLLLSSLAFEQNLSSALTDSLTNLPNERAFYLVLENQIAESQRYRDERPLTVLTIDIKNFAEINQKYGHSTGDNILYFAAEVIKNQLRRMDFLARSMSDEFLTVLPTASEEITQEIIERLNNIFNTSPFEISPDNKIIVQLNYGTATFWQDGETPHDLLKIAHLRKQKQKTSDNSKIIQFPHKSS